MLLMPQKDAVRAVTWMFEHLASSPIRTAETFRNAILGEGGIAMNPMLNINVADAAFLKDLIHRAVAEGRMIDFGYLPNAIIKTEAVRSRKMFEAGEFVHPYDSWLATSAWEGGFNGYYFCPHPEWEGAILVVELYGILMPTGDPAILVYDMVSIKVEGPDRTIVSPAFAKSPEMMTDEELRARGSNSLDPLVIMLRLLADASIPIIAKEEPVRLNKARAKTGKFPIPGHTLVNTRDYVAHFMHPKSGRGDDKGGHHASPISHYRRAHLRHLVSGAVIKVKSAKINWRDTAELHRMFYKI